MKCLLCTVAVWRACWPGAGGQEAAIIDKWTESGDVHLSVCVPKHRDPASGQPALRPQKLDFSLVRSLPLHFPSVHTHVAPICQKKFLFLCRKYSVTICLSQSKRVFCSLFFTACEYYMFHLQPSVSCCCLWVSVGSWNCMKKWVCSCKMWLSLNMIGKGNHEVKLR